MRIHTHRLALAVGLILLGCSEEPQNGSLAGGTGGAIFAATTGGSGVGTPATGGEIASAGLSAVSGSGGAIGTGGSGGPLSTGGEIAAGGAGAAPGGGGAIAMAGSGGAGVAAGGAVSAGGSIAGGGAVAIGGMGAGGDAGGAVTTGGAVATGGVAGAGGAAGSAGGGAGGTIAAPFSASYHMGADITWVQHDEFHGATYVDTDGVTKDILELLKNHGFNSIRLRTYVDPMAADGYDQIDGFGDIANTIEMAVRVRNAGMGLYIAFHMSDNWADPGKQCIPVAWQGSTLPELAQHVYAYMFESITALKAAGVTPDFVQVGNEITPGMLIHHCDGEGQPTSTAAVTGSASNWGNLGTLLKEGIRGVKEVDSNIKVVLHIDKGGNAATSVSWITSAQAQSVVFDAFADTSYVRWQGQPSSWQDTFETLTSTFPNLSFIIPEYANETATSPSSPSTMRIANDIVFNMPNNRGLGTWIYEPEHPVQAGVGVGLFIGDTSSGTLADPWPVVTADPDAMSDYEEMREDYASRL